MFISRTLNIFRDIWDRDIPTTSQTAKFSEFLLRSGHYGSLQLTTESVLPENLLGKLILVEDIPNFCLRDPLVLHSLLEKYRQCGRFPLVLIISESSSKADSNSRKLVPPKVCEELGIETISMNPIATTLMLKALERIASREKQAGNLSDLPTKSVLTDLAEKSRGDIRAALNSLQFSLMTKSDVDSEVTVKGKRKQLGKVPRKTPKFEEREENLLLFSALGKILYSKRSTDKPEPIHSAVAPQDRHKFSLELEPEDVVEKSHVDGMMFVCYLHENYVDFHQDIEVVERSAYYLR